MVSYLRGKQEEVVTENDFSSFDGLSDLLAWSVKNQDTKIAKETSEYFYKIFKTYRDSWNKEANSEGVIYPDRLYFLVYNTLEKILKQNNNSFVFLESRTIGGIWLFGEFDSPKISEQTYNWQWQNIILAVNNNRPDLVFLHWKNAYQYFKYNLANILPQYDHFEGELIVLNKTVVEERKKERHRYFEFHVALGGMLLYRGENEIIKRMFTYTQSTPPDYPLLPMHMNEVFDFYFNFFDRYEMKYSWISSTYPFPNLDGLNAIYIIKSWICKYVALLFIRQFNLITYLSFQKPKDQPDLPLEIANKKLWLESINYFKNQVEEVLKNKELIAELNYLPDQSCLEFFDELENKLKIDLDYTEQTVKPEEEKVKLFKKTSLELLKRVFSIYNPIYNPDPQEPKVDYKEIFIIGESMISDKSAFTKNGVSYLNFHSFISEKISEKYKIGIGNFFLMDSSEKYIYNEEDVFKSLRKLKLTNQHVIIAFGVDNLSQYQKSLNVKELNDDKFLNTPIIHLPYSRNVGKSFFILKKTELPYFKHEEIKKEIINLYELELIESKFKLYASVVDLNSNNKLRGLLEKEEGIDLSKQVWQGISFITKLKWAKKKRLVKIEFKNNLDNQSITNKVGDIRSFGEEN